MVNVEFSITDFGLGASISGTWRKLLLFLPAPTLGLCRVGTGRASSSATGTWAITIIIIIINIIIIIITMITWGEPNTVVIPYNISWNTRLRTPRMARTPYSFFLDLQA